MKQSKLFGKTTKTVSKDLKAPSHRFLIQGGFIAESVAGRYYFLPLGMKVRDKIVKVIEDAMNNSGAEKMITPVLHPLELWQETNRTSTAGFELMRLEDRRGSEFALGGTAEEMIVDVVRKYNISYKDLPFHIYQFSQKFRDELRARGGLLRVREFLMKDGYSFHVDEEDFKKEYEKMRQVYLEIFEKLGMDAFVVEADNGYIGGDYCHEFVVESENGESVFFVSEDGKYVAHEDVAKFKRDEINIDEQEKEFEIISQPEWVKTMDDVAKHYKLPTSRFLKNVVYKNRVSEEIVIATIRGDLEVNKTKLEQVLDCVGALEEATAEDLEKIGTKPGYVHAWGHENCKYVADLSLKTVKNFIGGQKEEKTDSINVNYGRDFEHEIIDDIALAKDGFLTEDGKQKLTQKKGIEVGNIFQLGQHYSSKMKATFVDEKGEDKFYYMGCYGIGIGRNMATVVETHHDEKGIVWPEEIAPFKVHIVELVSDDENVKKTAQDLYDELVGVGVDVLYDDRADLTAGEKFADADLIGCSYRVVISAKTLENEKFELKKRSEQDVEMLSKEDLLKVLK
ncbi:MAG: proline--tRNA ligase [Patescibacteria group bacterium]|nr:proline--tRNA ligase [Patescibacteria group bacterium]